MTVFYALNPECICPEYALILVKMRGWMPLFLQYALMFTDFGFSKSKNNGKSTVERFFEIVLFERFLAKMSFWINFV